MARVLATEGYIAMSEIATPATPVAGERKILPPIDTVPSIGVLDDAGVLGILKFTGPYTLTVPASGTAALESANNWTPTIRGSTTAGAHTYSTQFGRYIRQGALVTAIFYIAINSKDGAMAGNALIGGLPFTTKNIANYFQPGSISYWASLATAVIFLGIHAEVNATTAQLIKATAATVGAAVMVAADIANGTTIIGKLAYEAD